MDLSIIQQALENERPELERQYKARMEWALNQLKEEFPKNIWQAANSFTYFNLLNLIKPCLIGGDLDEVRTNRAASSYATFTIQEIMAKLQAKLGELDEAEVKCIGGTEFTLSGMKNGKKVFIRQIQILNVSSKGKLFNQYPTTIYLEGKRISEIAYKKL
jgi:hypothetical protein